MIVFVYRLTGIALSIARRWPKRTAIILVTLAVLGGIGKSNTINIFTSPDHMFDGLLGRQELPLVAEDGTAYCQYSGKANYYGDWEYTVLTWERCYEPPIAATWGTPSTGIWAYCPDPLTWERNMARQPPPCVTKDGQAFVNGSIVK